MFSLTYLLAIFIEFLDIENMCKKDAASLCNFLQWCCYWTVLLENQLPHYYLLYICLLLCCHVFPRLKHLRSYYLVCVVGVCGCAWCVWCCVCGVCVCCVCVCVCVCVPCVVCVCVCVGVCVCVCVCVCACVCVCVCGVCARSVCSPVRMGVGVVLSACVMCVCVCVCVGGWVWGGGWWVVVGVMRGNGCVWGVCGVWGDGGVFVVVV